MKAIYVCIGSACHLKGSYDVINKFKDLIEEHELSDKLEVRAKFCMGNCAGEGVSVSIDEKEVYSVLPANAEKFLKNTL